MVEDFNEDDYEIEDLSKSRKKGINSGRKGKGAERELCKILAARFNKPFSRSVGSGNRWGQVSNLPQHAKQTFAGDICCPEEFKWVIESKCGYEEDIDLNSFDSGISRIDKFIKQSLNDSVLSGRNPIIIWKRKRKNWLCFLRSIDLPKNKYEYMIIYRDWVCISLEDLLRSDDSYFFN